MAPISSSTSLERTYRYLRIAIAGTAVVIFTAVGVAMPVVGLLPSLSHYYYSPARTLFVGALICVSVCFLALSGRGLERALLDAAAVMVPIVAIVPTVVSPGSVPRVRVECDGSCLPAAVDADVDNGIASYLIIGVLILLLAAGLTIGGQVDRGAGAVSLSIAAAILALVGLAWWLWRPWFYAWGHFVGAVGFFGTIAAVAIVNAFWPSDRRMPPRWLKIAYTVIAVALALDVVALPIFGSLHVGDVYGVLVGETLALLLFFAFWVLQSVQYWGEADPSVR